MVSTILVNSYNFPGPGGPDWPDVTTFTYVRHNNYTVDFLIGGTWNDDGTIFYGVRDDSTFSSIRKSSPPWTTGYVPENGTVPLVLEKGTQRIRGLAFNSDGTSIFVCLFGAGTIEEIANAGTPYRPELGDLTSVTDSFMPSPNSPRSIDCSPDGTKIWYVDTGSGRDIYEINLSSADDLTTASMGNSYAPAEDGMIDMKFAPDGKKFYALGLDRFLYEYTVSVDFDITTASYTGNRIDANAEATNQTVHSFDVSPDGTKMVVVYGSTSQAQDNDLGYYTSS